MSESFVGIRKLVFDRWWDREVEANNIEVTGMGWSTDYEVVRRKAVEEGFNNGWDNGIVWMATSPGALKVVQAALTRMQKSNG